MRKKQKQYRAVENVAILRKHLIEKVPVSGLCDEYGLSPEMEPCSLALAWRSQ